MTLLKLILVVPLAAVLLAFAFANRDWVTVAFDPTGYVPLPPIQAPQYAVMFAAAAVGALAGGFLTWVGQSRHRRAARNAQADAYRLRQELQAARIAPPQRELVRS